MWEVQETQVQYLGWEDPLEEEMQPTPVPLPGDSHGQSSLARCSPWGRKQLDTTEVPALALANKPNLNHYKGFVFQPFNMRVH